MTLPPWRSRSRLLPFDQCFCLQSIANRLQQSHPFFIISSSVDHQCLNYSIAVTWAEFKAGVASDKDLEAAVWHPLRRLHA